MDKNRETKKRKKNNEQVMRNLSNKKYQHRKDNTILNPDEMETEITDVADNLINLKGAEKKAYVDSLLNRNDKVAIAKGLIIIFNNLIEDSKNSSSETILAHKETLSRLDARLTKLNENDNPYEVRKIYEQISDLSDKIQEIGRGQQDILGKLGGLAILILGGLAGVFINSRNNKN